MKSNDRVVDPSMDNVSAPHEHVCQYADATSTIMMSVNVVMIDYLTKACQIILKHKGFSASLGESKDC